MKYFSMFSGIGGVELGILCSYRKKNEGVQKDSQRNDEEGKGLESSEGQGACAKDRQNSKQSNSGSNSRATCIGFSEIDKYATQIYKKHFKHKEYGDAKNIKWTDVEDFDFLCGGFPCQAFSIAGKRKGFNDTRGTLFFEIARVAQEKQPRLLLLENVKGLLSHDKGRTFGVILNTLDELGYDLQWQVLNSKNFGVPQNRERVFIVGHLRGTSRPEVFPIGNTMQSNSEASNKQGQKYIIRGRPNMPYKQGERKLRFERYNKICPTLSENCAAGDQKNIVMPQIRRLTPTECERLQSFPDGWTEGVSDTQRYKCLGNAVTVNVIQAIMERLINNHH